MSWLSDLFKPSVQQINTTDPNVQKWVNDPRAFMQQFGGQNGLAGLAGNQLANAAAQNGSPEASTFAQILPLLMNMAQRGNVGMGNDFKELQFGNQFSELSDPAGNMNPLGQAMGTMAAATPIFDRNLQSANANLATIAPGRFGSAIAQEGRDLNATALQDFNLFANQAIQQALGLEQQNRESVRNFGLGARGLQQGAVQNTAQNQLAARGLQQGAVQDSRQAQLSGQGNQLAALQAMMNGSSIAGNGQFNRQLQAGQFGLDQQNAAINPILQLLGLAQGNTPIVGQSPMGNLMNMIGTAASVYGATKGFGGGNQGGTYIPGRAPGGNWAPGTGTTPWPSGGIPGR